MSMSTPAGGGNRRSPISRPGAKPNDAPGSEADESGNEPDIVITRPVRKASGAARTAGSAATPDPSDTADPAAPADSDGAVEPSTAPEAAEASTVVAGQGAAGKTAAAKKTAAKKAAAGGANARGGNARPAGAKAAGTKAGGAKAGGAKAAGTKAAGAKAGAGKARNAGGGAGGRGPAGKGSGRKPVKPVNINQSRNWGPIALFSVIILLVVGIIGFGAYEVYQNGRSWEDRAAAINGIKNYRKDDPKILTYNHKPGKQTYAVLPPVGGDHNPNWQRCLGDVYDAPIANEHAVHSLEHGAVWITYRPDLPAAEVDTLAKKVRGHDFTLMSPFPGLDKPISVQTWGYQLKVDKASDPRIDQFIKALREVSAREPNTPCSSGAYITATGTTPHDIAPPPSMPTS